MTTTDKAAFGKALRDARTTAGMSLRAFAKRLGVSHAYLCEVEHGRKTPLSVARVLEVSTLLGEDPEPLLLARAQWSGVVEVPLTGDTLVDLRTVTRALNLTRGNEAGNGVVEVAQGGTQE